MSLLPKRFSTLILVIVATLLLAACGNTAEQSNSGASNSTDNATQTTSSGDQSSNSTEGQADKGEEKQSDEGEQTSSSSELGKETIKLGHMAWTDCEAFTNIAKVVLEDAGYQVELVSADAGVVYQALADGQVDAMLCSWLPATHADYVDKFADKIEAAGTSMEGARLGWAVPSYVEINSIEELKGKGDMFKGTIVGIDPGAGLMRLSEQVLKDYGLADEYELKTSSDAAMTASLDSAIQKNEPIVVTSWAPHIMWAKFDVKWLEDPKGTLGEAEHIVTQVHKGFKDEAPRAYEILSQMNIDPTTLAEVMLKVVEGGDVEEVAKEFVQNNQDMVNTWTAVE